MQKTNLYFLITGVVMVGVIILLVITSVQSSSHFNTSNQNISTLSSQNDKLKVDLAAAQAQINSLSDLVTSLQQSAAANNTKLTTLTTDLDTAKKQLSTISSTVSSLNTQISSIQSGSTAVANQMAALQTTVTTLDNDITALEGTLTTLQSSVTTVTSRVTALEASANAPITLISNQAINQGINVTTPLLASYTPSYNGYLYFNITTGVTLASIRVTNNSNFAASVDYPITVTTATAFTSAVVAGNNYTISFITGANATTAATVSVTFYRQ